jgi:hypothetical protein
MTLAMELLVRDGCHLCDEFLLGLSLDHPALAERLQLRDVDADPRLAAEFGLRVPVLRIAGRTACEGRYDRDEVRAVLGKLCTGPQGRDRARLSPRARSDEGVDVDPRPRSDNAGGENRPVPKGLRE